MIILKSKSIQFRPITVSDAEFVLSLRLDSRYNTFLSEVGADLDAQKKWISSYKKDEALGSQYYFIIERLDGVPCGTVRLYDFCGDSFCWGSWILNENKTQYAAIESAFLVYEFGFQELGFKRCHFDVMKDNQQVISFHEKLGAVKTGEDEHNFYFEIDPKVILIKKQKYKRIL
jgi:RimJ/RimL family protein N-acetyltransferase